MGTIFLVISREISIEHPSVGLASLAQLNHNWASEASPTLGCSIEISRDTRKMVPIMGRASS